MHARAKAIIVEALLRGRTQPFGPNGEPSAIRKTPVEGPVEIGPLGLTGDQQAYHRHGGPNKAVLHYAAEHYAAWSELYLAFALRPGGFGENISTHGMTEADVCLGDRYRLGDTVMLEVSQPRQPCWKLGWNAGERELPALMQERAAIGWYYRVLVPGTVQPGDTLVLEERPHPDWPLARLIGGFYGTPLDSAFLNALAALPALSDEFRDTIAERLRTGRVEDWSRRLYGEQG